MNFKHKIILCSYVIKKQTYMINFFAVIIFKIVSLYVYLFILITYLFLFIFFILNFKLNFSRFLK